MTMPSERTRALISAAELLQELRFSSGTPDDIRAKVIHVLRHFPDAASIEHEAECQLRRQQEVTKEAWLLPVDYYEQSRITRQDAAAADSKLLEEVARDMRATMRTEAPHPGDAQHWIEVHDTQTGRITWTRRDLSDEWQRLQEKIRGIQCPRSIFAAIRTAISATLSKPSVGRRGEKG